VIIIIIIIVMIQDFGKEIYKLLVTVIITYKPNTAMLGMEAICTQRVDFVDSAIIVPWAQYSPGELVIHSDQRYCPAITDTDRRPERD